MSPKLILIRHSLPDIDPQLPSHMWGLSEEGRRRCGPLSETLSEHRPEVIATSKEPKATETGRILSQLLNRPFESVDGLHEHDRSNAEFFESKEDFEAAVSEFFANPQRLVFGLETAEQARQRFSTAINRLIERHKGRSLAVVTHGTVMTLFVSRLARIEPFTFWKQLATPSLVVLSLPDFELIGAVESVS